MNMSDILRVKLQYKISTLNSNLTQTNIFDGNHKLLCYRTDVADCNNMTEAGIYQCINALNRPTPGWVTYFIIPFGGDNIKYNMQLAFQISTYNIYSRYCNNGTWSNWIQLSIQ